jgi:hypothetical protein
MATIDVHDNMSTVQGPIVGYTPIWCSTWSVPRLLEEIVQLANMYQDANIICIFLEHGLPIWVHCLWIDDSKRPCRP